MNENQMLLLLCCVGVLGRIPRLVERWNAPMLRGKGWFFNVEIASDFHWMAPASLLRNYRIRLFLPWMIELPVDLALLLSGNIRGVFIVMAVTALFTRLNYYLARQSAEQGARIYEIGAVPEAEPAVTLSLQPRSLRDYTNPWIEAALAAITVAAFLYLGSMYLTRHDWNAVRQPFALLVFQTYLQLGVLLAKRGIVRARYLAPAMDAEQHLAWRESLRRLSTAICDYMRLFLVITLLPICAAAAGILEKRSAQMVYALVVMTSAVVITALEWRRRLRYLEVARRTKPARLLVRRDVPDDVPLICFQPSFSALLLNGANGYSLNLASPAARSGAVYISGLAILWLLFVRFTG
jgi:hypothetical protein